MFLDADCRRENLVAINRDDELKRWFMTLDANVSFSNRAQEPSVKNIFAVSWKIILDQRAAARSKRKSLDMLPLRYNSADRECRRSSLGFGIANRKFTDAQCRGQIALEQERRSRERSRNVVETEI